MVRREDDPRPWHLGERIAYAYMRTDCHLANQRCVGSGEPLSASVRRWRAERAVRAAEERARVQGRRRLP